MEEIIVRHLEKDALDFDIGDGCRARALVWPGMGSVYRSMHYIEVAPLHHTRALRHDSEAAYFIVKGSGKVMDHQTGEEYLLQKGKMILLDAGTVYSLKAFGQEQFVCVGGPCPPDLSLYPIGRTY